VSVDFHPVKVVPRRRRLDLLRIGVFAVVIALAVAIVKPWQPGGLFGPPVPPLAGAAAASASPGPSAAPSRTADTVQEVVSRIARPPTWADLESAVMTHDTWGVRAILLSRGRFKPDPRPRYVEVWTSTAPSPDGRDTAHVAREDRSIVALGITFPPGSEPQDVRIWRLDANDELEWIDARPLDREQPDGAFVFLRFGAAETGFQAWDAGRYRIDVLGRDRVRRIAVQIPERLDGVAPPDAPPATEAIVVGRAGDPRAVRVGLFASVNGRGLPIAARDSPLLDESAAWLEALRGPDGASPPVVAKAYLPRAAWLGVMLTARASVRWATIRRLAPDTGFDPPPLGGGLSRFHGQTPFVVFGAPRGGAWPAGVYAISVAWADSTGSHVGTWHVELRPGPIQPLVPIQPLLPRP
jgi:hypothetical protein